VQEVLVQRAVLDLGVELVVDGAEPSRVTFTPATYLTMPQKLQGLTLAERT
jgi:hypothetical protein